MRKNIKLITFLTDYDINQDNLDEYVNISNTTYDELLNKIFKNLNKWIYELKFSVDLDDINLIDKSIQLISLLCSSIEFKPEDILTLKKRIKKSRESLLIHAKNDDNPDLIILANKLDEIVLDKSLNKDDLILLVKELINKKEASNIIKKFININKDAVISNLVLLDYVFQKTIESMNNDNQDIFYYITLLKLFYTSRIKKYKYVLELSEHMDNPYTQEIMALLNGVKRSLTPDEILNKYGIISTLPASPIILPTIETTTDSIFTIDDTSTNLRDDGLCIKRDGNKYIVKINIADIGSIIVPHCIDDLNARNNYRNIHLNNAVKMLPFNLRRDLSLNQGHKSKVITMCVVMNDSGDLEDYYLELNDVYVAKNISYDESDKLITKGSGKYNKDLSDLYYLACALEAKNAEKNVYWAKKESSRKDFEISQSKGFKIIREFMVLYNSLIGQFTNEQNIPYVYRYQDEEYITSLMRKKDIPENDQIKQIINSLYLDSKFSIVPRYHAGIKTDIYTQSTDPLRKYPDLYNQQLLHKFYFGDIDFAFDYDEFRSNVDYFNQRNRDLIMMKAEYNRGMRLTKNL